MNLATNGNFIMESDVVISLVCQISWKFADVWAGGGPWGFVVMMVQIGTRLGGLHSVTSGFLWQVC